MNANGDVDADADTAANGVTDGLANAGADMSQVASLMSNERNQQQMRNKSLAKVTQRAFKDHKWEKQLPSPSLSQPLPLLFFLLSPLFSYSCRVCPIIRRRLTGEGVEENCANFT